MSFCVAVKCGMEGDNPLCTFSQVTPVIPKTCDTRAHFIKALEMFAGISNLLGIFTAHLDESSKNIATLLKITIKFFGSINYLPSYIGLGFFLPVLHVQGRKEFQIQHFVYKLVCQTTLQWFITVFHPAVVPRFPLRIISPAFGRKTDDDFSRLLPAHLVKEKLQF